MSLRRNFIAGLANSAWSALIGLAVVPFYLKYLGMEAYGLIGFFATLQAIFWIMDLGLSSTINREVARFSASGNLNEASKLLHTLAVIYWSMGAIIALLIIATSSWIANYWLQSNHLPLTSITHALMLMGVVIVGRWPIALYQGVLMGAQRITVSSAISIVMATLGNFGAVVVVAFISPTIEAFFIWQAGVGLVYAATMRWAAWRIIERQNNAKFDIKELKHIWRFSAGVSGLALATSILMQADKVLLSSILSLSDFGKYTLAWVVAGGLYILLTPVFNVIYPRFSALVAAGETEVLSNLYRMGTRLLAALLFPVATVAGIFAEDLVYLWTGNQEVSRGVAPILSLLLMGTAINGIMIFPYALQLAYGMVRLPLLICLILIVGTVPMTILLATEFGAIGGASAWLLMNSIYLLMGSWLTHRAMLKEIGFKWLVWDAGIPLAISLFVIRVAGEKIHELGQSHVANIIIAAVVVLLGILISIFTSPRLVRMLRNGIKQRKSGSEVFTVRVK